jgi:hypothetical protein
MRNLYIEGEGIISCLHRPGPRCAMFLEVQGSFSYNV